MLLMRSMRLETVPWVAIAKSRKHCWDADYLIPYITEPIDASAFTLEFLHSVRVAPSPPGPSSVPALLGSTGSIDWEDELDAGLSGIYSFPTLTALDFR